MGVAGRCGDSSRCRGKHNAQTAEKRTSPAGQVKMAGSSTIATYHQTYSTGRGALAPQLGALIVEPERPHKFAAELLAFKEYARVKQGLSPVTIASCDEAM